MTNFPSYILAVTCSLLHHHYSFLWWWHKGKKASPPPPPPSFLLPYKTYSPIKKSLNKNTSHYSCSFFGIKILNLSTHCSLFGIFKFFKENCCNWPLNENINLQAFTETLTVFYLKKCIRKSIWKSFLHMHTLQNNFSFKVVLRIRKKMIQIRIRHQNWEKPWITNLKI